jgi:hypothetical protein
MSFENRQQEDYGQRTGIVAIVMELEVGMAEA